MTINRSLGKNIWREIRSTAGRFIAIFAISALGAGFYAGLKATNPDMIATGDAYYAQQHLADIRLLSTLGFTEEDVEAVRRLDYVQAAAPGYGLDVLVQNPEGALAVHLMTLPKDTGEDNAAYLNRPVLVAGNLPQTPGECLADETAGYGIGQAITLSDENEEATLDLMREDTFRVVGLVRSPAYVSLTRGNTNIGTGKVAFYLYLMQDAFDSEYYTEVQLELAGGRAYSSFSAEYEALVDSRKKQLEALGQQRVQQRFDEMQAELDDARSEYEEGRAEADEELGNALREIQDAEEKLADGWREYEENRQKLADAQREIAEGEAELEKARVRLMGAQWQYDSGMLQYTAARQQYEELAAGLEAAAAVLGSFNANLGVLNALAQGPMTDPAEIETFTRLAIAMAESADFAATLLEAAAQQPVADQIRQQTAAARTAVAEGRWADACTALDAVAPYESAMLGAIAGTQAQLPDMERQLAESRRQLDAAKTSIDDGWRQVLVNEEKLAEAKKELADGQKQLADARIELEEAEIELADGRAEYEEKKAEAEAELADAKREIEDAQEDLDALGEPKWYVRTREDNPGYSGFASDTTRIDAIAAVIPVFFFLVAALVCLTTMTRMVEEQRTQIGILKALGYSRGAIAFKYLLYAAGASTLGAGLGVAVGFAVFPRAIWSAYGILYAMPALVDGDIFWIAVASIGASVLATTLATLAACAHELRSRPAKLMRPKAPKPGKRVFLEYVTPLWRRMSFMAKVTTRNLIRSKKRFFMTVIGVAGCAALLVTGFGLRDSITGIVPMQYGGINHYDMIVALTEPSSRQADSELNQKLPEYGQSLYYAETPVDIWSEDGNNMGMTTYLQTAEDPDLLAEYFSFRDRKSQEPLAFPPAGGVMITEKLAKRLQVEVGDTIEVARANEEPVTLTVGGICENYVFNYVFTTPQVYAQVFGQAPEYESLMLQLNEEAAADEDAVLKQILELEPVAGAVSITAMQGEMDDMFESLNAVVWLIIISAGLLAVVVLYNLTNINITERVREIATLKVLGFYNGEVANYVFRENLLLTLLGAGVGLVLGVFLHNFVMVSAEIDEVMFRRVIEPMSYVWSVLFTMVCALLVNLLMTGRLKKVDMVESLKANE